MAIFETGSKSQQKLSDLCSDCFMLILQLRATNEYGEAGVLRKRVLELLDNLNIHPTQAYGLLFPWLWNPHPIAESRHRILSECQRKSDNEVQKEIGKSKMQLSLILK